ncbi:hypothetical protein E5161_11640 [Cohnella pontilimi]|uniref:Uncharacterized protein n=1 Tax=Cohnella pontilimi TaxID=2564100 RepID=A0A4U0FB86_9BACL|nr:hypothetical protein [Cohnella pontilimi]TJY41848.1 hypothetical protein E5161_11640 [Cohnella pontilimi]
MAAFQEIERQIKDVLSMLNGMDFADRQSVRKQVEDCLTGVLDFMQQGDRVSPADSEAVRNTRSQIAECRQRVHQCLPVLEQLRTEWADRYRNAIGDEKNEFEKLSDVMQQQKSSEAYRWKNNFADVQKAVDQLAKVNGGLMDLSSEVEREHAETLPPPPDPGPMDRKDRDPDMSSNRS